MTGAGRACHRRIRRIADQVRGAVAGVPTHPDVVPGPITRRGAGNFVQPRETRVVESGEPVEGDDDRFPWVCAGESADLLEPSADGLGPGKDSSVSGASAIPGRIPIQSPSGTEEESTGDASAGHSCPNSSKTATTITRSTPVPPPLTEP
ncbi:hypothetical protein OG439_07845 [Amycolatopsis sp. NBC_01307]|uniref:hypothetical protein n=1 Tax=Amycolatopsis sp. NBC_01307 TaxID=2903561 RepID=UPI002E1140C6|nr:hypothetical protein OG439_07845 [Amycolatopsis sp. NBC_01307]